MKQDRNALCACGSGKKYKKCCAEVHKAQPSQVHLSILTSAQLLQQAGEQYVAGRIDAAMALCQSLLARGERTADAGHLHGVLLLAKGDPAGALAALDAASRLSSHPHILSNRGLAQLALGRFADATQSFHLSLRGDSRQILVWMNLAKAQRCQGDLAGAEQSYRHVLGLNGDFLDAISALARVLLDTHRASEALELLLDTESRVLPSSDMLSVKGMVLRALDRPDDAVAVYREAIRLFPGDAQTHSRLGAVLRECSEMEEALLAFEQAHRLKPSLETALDLHLSLPPVLRAQDEIPQWRQRFAQGIQKLAESGQTGSISEAMFAPSIFYLAFHGEDDKPLMESLSSMYRQLIPDLSYVAPHVLESGGQARLGKRFRIGFYSKFIHTHSVSRCFSHLIKRLASTTDCDVYLASQQDIGSEAAQATYGGFSGQFVHLPDDFLSARQALADLQLDALVYLDIGMDPMSYFMAHARLAPVQLVMGGHPVTSGITTIDYVVSSGLGEPADAASHYIERLLLLPGLPVVYNHPELPERLKTRAELGLPEQGRLYLCPMMLQKMHPDFDAAIAGILERDPQGQVVLFKHPHARWEEQLAARFAHSISAALRERLHFHRWLYDYGDFIAANAAADVVIDPFHFGIGSTVIATFAVGTPIVSWPGRYLRGRVGLAYCRLLGLDECIASDPQDYIARAVAIASDAGLRQRLHERILARKSRLFDNEQPVLELAELFAGLAQSLAQAEEVL